MFKSVCQFKNKQEIHNEITKSIYQSLAKVCITTNLDKIHEQDKPAAQALQSKTDRSSRRNNKKDRKYINTSEETSVSDESSQSSTARHIVVNYPKRVKINRKITYLGRVTQPNMSRSHESLLTFKIVRDSSNAFNITEKGGIIYANNTSIIENDSNKTYQ